MSEFWLAMIGIACIFGVLALMIRRERNRRHS